MHGVVKEEAPGYKKISDADLAEKANQFRKLLLSYQA